MSQRDYELPPELNLFVQSVRDFMKREVLPVDEALEADAILFPDDEVERLQAMTQELELFNPGTPVEYGGPGLDFLSLTVFQEEIAKCRQGLYNPGGGAFGYGVNPILYAGTEEQKERYLLPCLRGKKKGCFAITEPTGGSDPARAIRSRAVEVDGGWQINGSKLWITHAGIADFVTVFIRTDDGPVGERGEITCFIVDTGTEGYEIGPTIPVIRPEYPHEIYFHDCFVPENRVLGERGGGFDLLKSLLMQNRIPYAAQCIGVAQVALDMAVEYSQQRETFGKPLASRQAIQWMIADSAAELHAVRLVTYNAAKVKAAGKPFHIESSIAKVMATETAERVLDRSIQIHGGMGLAKELPLERWYREMRTRRIGEGPSEVHRMVIARDLLGAHR